MSRAQEGGHVWGGKLPNQIQTLKHDSVHMNQHCQRVKWYEICLLCAALFVSKGLGDALRLRKLVSLARQVHRNSRRNSRLAMLGRWRHVPPRVHVLIPRPSSKPTRTLISNFIFFFFNRYEMLLSFKAIAKGCGWTSMCVD